ncbi:MAG TPA: hypothetical protein P5081_12075 [Phycisphaerae bacterium]|nr:hypothetical protein [Phycisphaerae bacterium]HRW53616.1 hypothetical protein [Phycisphaerae bacterium]
MSNHAFEDFAPTLLSPGFLGPTCNAAADGDLDYLRRQLVKHHFVLCELPGAEMYDEHGFRLHIGRVLDVPTKPKDLDGALLPDLAARFADGPARRVAIIVYDADRLIAADVQRFLALVHAVESAARALSGATPATQLLLFLTGPPPAFREIEPSAKRRAEAKRGPRAMTSDFDATPWSQAREFDLRAHHALTISHAAWYYASLGRRAESPDDRWHCVEDGDTLTFYRADDGAPCVAGIFARMKTGMQLVGVRYESDERVFQFPWEGEDPFTYFRRLCDQLSLL